MESCSSATTTAIAILAKVPPRSSLAPNSVLANLDTAWFCTLVGLESCFLGKEKLEPKGRGRQFLSPDLPSIHSLMRTATYS